MLLAGIRASLVLLVIYATIHVNGDTEPIDIIPCNGDMEFIPGGTPGSCYSMMPVLWGKMDNRNARIYCLMDNNNVFSLLPTPQTHGELQRLTEWAIRQGKSYRIWSTTPHLCKRGKLVSRSKTDVCFTVEFL